MTNWKNLTQFIEAFDKHAYGFNQKEDNEFFNTWEIDMAKAIISDGGDCAVTVAKIILAFKDIQDIEKSIYKY